jgi:uncharacterized protein (DUF2236 family)
MRRRWILTLTFALLCGCSSAGTASHSPAGTVAGSSHPTPVSVDTARASVQQYLTAVNKLCDDLLPKVIAVTNGGSLDIPLKDFFAQLPAHTKLRADFDRQLARVPVPPAATRAARALAAYIRFANQLDARRLRAARSGQAAYDREIAAEKKDAANDPTIVARTAAGFSESCNAR